MPALGATIANFKLMLSAAGMLSSSVGDTSQDAILQQYLDAAAGAVRAYLQRGRGRVAFAGWPEEATDTLYLSGSGQMELVLPYKPVTALTELYLDLGAHFGQAPGAFGASTLLAAGVDYALRLDDGTGSSASGIIYRLAGSSAGGSVGNWNWGATEYGSLGNIPTLTAGRGGPVWPKAPGCLKAVLTAGYAEDAVPVEISQAVLNVAAYIRRTAPLGGLFLQSENLRDYGYTIGQRAMNIAPEIGDTRQMLARFRTAAVG